MKISTLFIFVFLTNLNISLGVTPKVRSTVEFHWVEGDLVLEIKVHNTLKEAISICNPLYVNKESSSQFGGLKMRIFSLDGTDETGLVFGRQIPPLPAYISWMESSIDSGLSDDIIVRMIDDLKADKNRLPAPGWKIHVRLIGYTPSQVQKNFAIRMRAWKKDIHDIMKFPSTEESHPKNETILADELVTIPAK